MTILATPDQRLPSPTRIESQVERVLLAGVPAENHAELLSLLRSPDRTVREVALILIQLDRDDAARRRQRQRSRAMPSSSVPAAKQAELQPLLQSPDRSVREMAQVLAYLEDEDTACPSPPRRLAKGWGQG